MKVRDFAARGLKSAIGSTAALHRMWVSTMCSLTGERARRASGRLATAVLTMSTLLALTVSLSQLAQAQTYMILHAFSGGPDGDFPLGGLTMDRGGNLYGTTFLGGRGRCGGSGCGMVFRLSNRGSDWTLAPLYTFDDHQIENGVFPTNVTFGPDGSLYGTTQTARLTPCPAS